MSWPTTCESGQACNAALGAPSSTNQGMQFLSMHTQHHGGKRGMRGGAVAELASYPTSFAPSILPSDLHGTAGVASLDKAISDLSQFRQFGGKRTRRNRKGGALGFGPAESGGPLITAAMEKQAFLNPQWYDENLVNPAFHGPTVAKVGGKRKSTKKSKKSRKSRKQEGGKRKHRKSSRKSRKQGGGKRKARKASRKSKKSRKTSRKTSRKH